MSDNPSDPTQPSSDPKGMLWSLRDIQERRNAAASHVSRPPGSNVDLLHGIGNESSEQKLALCSMSILMPFTFRSSPVYQIGQDSALIALAIQHLNTGNGTLVPQIEGIDERCPMKFTLEASDTQFQQNLGLEHIVSQVNRKYTSDDNGNLAKPIPCAFVGDFSSSVTMTQAIVSGIMGIPQVSYFSVSTELDDKTRFPLFGRTVPSTVGSTIPVILYLRDVLELDHVAVLHTNDAYGNAYLDSLRQAAVEYAPGLSIVQIPVEESEEFRATYVEAAIATIKASRYRYVLCSIGNTFLIEELVREAYDHGVIGNGLHQWLFSAEMSVAPEDTFEKDSMLHHAYRGSGFIVRASGERGTPKFDHFSKVVAEMKNDADLNYLNAQVWPPRYNATTGERSTWYYRNDPGFLSPLSGVDTTILAYEAAIALGLAACNALDTESMTLSGRDHYEAFKATKFDGLSGSVAFDNFTGTRDPQGLTYKVFNLVEKSIQNDADTISFDWETSALFENSTWVEELPFVYSDGTNRRPVDIEPIENIGSAYSKRQTATIASLSVVMVGVLMALLFRERRRKRSDKVSLIGREELAFDDPAKVLGQGTFGLVLLAEYRGTQVAVKQLRSSDSQESSKKEQSTSSATDVESQLATSARLAKHLNSSRNKHTRSNLILSAFSRKHDSRVGLMDEMQYLSKLRHPCITTIMGVVMESFSEPMIVMEYMEHGSLYDVLHNETMALDGDIMLPILRDITQGMRFLHAAEPQVIHGDLKSANILVDSRFRGKVADFGLSSQNTRRRGSNSGTPYWMAPELLCDSSVPNTTASDVFSFGVILYEVFSRKDPYEGEDPQHVLEAIVNPTAQKRLQAPSQMPGSMQALMVDCFELDPSHRSSFEEIDLRLKRVDADIFPASNTNKSHVSLFDIFPRHVVEALQEGRKVEAEHKDNVTIFFSDIVGFTNISAQLDPRKVANMLDRLYSKLDDLSRNHDVYKVETIGDAFMAVSNLVKDQSQDHAKRIAEFAIDAIQAANETLIDEDDPSLGHVNIRVGFHSGSVVADVVGNRNPRYCLFGDTVNTASRMESNSEANRINCSQASADILVKNHPAIRLQCRGLIPIKGKGDMECFWVSRGENNVGLGSKSDYLDSRVLEDKLKERLSRNGKVVPGV